MGDLGNLEGSHQHGFRESTVTAMLEIPSIIAKELDSNKKVLISGTDVKSLIDRTEISMNKHVTWLESIGMIVNINKNKAVLFSRSPVPSLEIKVKVSGFRTSPTMKILGVIFDSALSWKPQVEKVLKIARGTIHGLRVLRRTLPLQQFMNILTSQFFSKIYYGSQVWLSSLYECDMKRIESIHYRALRVGIFDFKNQVSREIIDLNFKRITPREWSEYSISQIMIRVFTSKSPESLFTCLNSHAYFINRPQRLRFFDSSKTRVGFQCIENKVGIVAS